MKSAGQLYKRVNLLTNIGIVIALIFLALLLARHYSYIFRTTQPIVSVANNTAVNMEITASDLKTMIEENDVLVLDVDERTHYAQGHIPNATNIPLDELEVRATRELRHSDRIVVYCRCRADGTSNRVRHYLNDLGFPHALVLKGGLHAWQESGFALQTKAQAPVLYDQH